MARYTIDSDQGQRVSRGTAVVISTDRGTELGEVLEIVPGNLSAGHEAAGSVDRIATAADRDLHRQRQQQAAAAFEVWCERIHGWKLELELMDVEQTLDGARHILYVLNERGAETTRLALLAAAGGFGIVSVQPVSAAGIVDGGQGGGCGSGCGCSH